MSVRATSLSSAAPDSKRVPPALRPRVMTAEEFDALPSEESRFLEVYDGVVREKMTPIIRHGGLQGNIYYVLHAWGVGTGQGRPYPEVHCALRTNPLVRLVPDVMFVSAARVPIGDASDQVFQGAPDLAVEILSRGDSAAHVLDKVATYLRYGTRLVWIVDPVSRSISVHAPDTTPVVLAESATISGGDVLAGFAIKVGDLLDGQIEAVTKPRKKAAKKKRRK